MFFKNAYVFAFTRSFEKTGLELNAALQENEFTPCASTEFSHFGWTSALSKGTALTHESGGNILICARKEEKILPTPVIKDMVAERVDQLEAEQGRSATKKEREQFKEDIVFELLPHAFSRITDTHAYINAKENIIVINSASRGKAEDLLALLRKSLGVLPVTSVSPDMTVDEHMTNWVKYNDTYASLLDSDFSLGYEARFNSIGDDGAIATMKNQDLCSDEVQAHLDADQYVTKLELDYDKSMLFMLHDDLSIKRIKFADVIQEQNDDIDDKLDKLDADFALMAGELNRMINALHTEFSVSAIDYLD